MKGKLYVIGDSLIAKQILEHVAEVGLYVPVRVYVHEDEQGQEKRIYLKSKTSRFAGLSLARSVGLEPATFSVRSHSPSQTGRDRERHRETKPCFYRQFSTSKGTGTDRERHGVVVPLWYRTPLAYSTGGREQVDTAYEDHQILSPPCS